MRVTAVISEHYQLANQEDRAAYWYGRAGQDAVTLYANTAAIHYLTLALDLTAQDDDGRRYTLLSACDKAYDGIIQPPKISLHNSYLSLCLGCVGCPGANH